MKDRIGFFIKETLINSSFVIPAKAGIQKFKDLDSGLRRNDELFRPSLIILGVLGALAVQIILALLASWRFKNEFPRSGNTP